MSAPQDVQDSTGMQELVIPGRFNGPPNSGNGGYSCGALAAHVDGVATVRLHAPPPLDTPMSIAEGEAGAVELRHGERLIATGRPGRLDIDIPAAPDLAQARRAMEGFPFYEGHPLGTCFVCGPDRPHRDGLELFTGPVDDSGVVAAPWLPAPDLLDGEGLVRPEFVWSALDCPGSYAALAGLPVQVLLGELTLEQHAPVPGDRELVVYAWPLGGEGRKYYGGTALASADGDVLAHALTTWIVLKV